VKRLQELSSVNNSSGAGSQQSGFMGESNKYHVMVSGGWEGSADIYDSGAPCDILLKVLRI